MGQLFRSDRSLFEPVSQNPAAMAERIMRFAPASDAEALKLLRASFPDCPLSARVAALAVLMRRQSAAHAYSPR
jgi:hypothetical protein